jgi:Flp pilus assembly pilin Flp
MKREHSGRAPSVRRSEKGQGMAEYIIIVILVAIIVLIGVKLFGKSVINQFNNATSEIKDLRQT